MSVEKGNTLTNEVESKAILSDRPERILPCRPRRELKKRKRTDDTARCRSEELIFLVTDHEEEESRCKSNVDRACNDDVAPCEKWTDGRKVLDDTGCTTDTESGETDLDTSDSSEYDTDLEEKGNGQPSQQDGHATTSEEDNTGVGHVTYVEVCRCLGTVPMKKIIDQLHGRELLLSHVGMNSADSKALACALWHNTCLEALDLEDNGLTGEDLVPIINIFKSNIHIASLSVSENVVGVLGAMSLDDVLQETQWLTHLDLSGTRLGDKETEYIAAGIQNNNSLRWLNLSHNEISVAGSKKLGRALGDTSTLQFLDLSWNHIRMAGAVAICKGIKVNSSIINLNMSWNGLGFEGSLALEETLRDNTCLKVLDISNNRVNWEGVKYVAKGMKKNYVLQMLKIGSNPINMEGCYELLKAVAVPRSQVIHIGLDDIPVNGAVLTVVDDILKRRAFSITHGGILDTKDVVGIKREKRDDPVTLLVRYLAMIGMRVIDIFRSFDTDYDGQVSKHLFIRGLKKIGTPLGDSDLRYIADRLDKQKKGYITYSNLSNGVRSHMRDERLEVKRQEVREKIKIEKQRRILQTELPALFQRNYVDDLYSLFLLAKRQNGSSPAQSQVSVLNSENGGRKLSGPDQLPSSELPPISLATRSQSISVPNNPTVLKHTNILSYMDVYLERRKSQANFDVTLLPHSVQANSRKNSIERLSTTRPVPMVSGSNILNQSMRRRQSLNTSRNSIVQKPNKRWLSYIDAYIKKDRKNKISSGTSLLPSFEESES